MSEKTITMGRKREKGNKQKLLALRTDLLALRWTPFPGARSAPGAALEGPSADQRNPRRAPEVYVYGVF
eukprot:3444262-Pyramimonas_sp.AAC.1